MVICQGHSQCWLSWDSSPVLTAVFYWPQVYLAERCVFVVGWFGLRQMVIRTHRGRMPWEAWRPGGELGEVHTGAVVDRLLAMPIMGLNSMLRQKGEKIQIGLSVSKL